MTEVLLAGFPRPAHEQKPADYEFSIRLLPGRIERWGRFGVWLPGKTAEAFVPIRQWLEKMGAPEEALAAQAATLPPGRQGVAVAVGDTGTEFRLYLHGIHPETQANVYEAVRWGTDGRIAFSRYTFHFAPETPTGERPGDLVPEWAREAVQALADEEWVLRSSGFWLRHDDGQLKQVDVAFPWRPKGETLGGLMALADRFNLSAEDRSFIAALPIRHIAVRAGTEGGQAVTLYCSSTLSGVPATEAELQEQVCGAALRMGLQLQSLYASQSWSSATSHSARSTLDHFYSGDLDLWRSALGPGMHYHHGVFDLPCADPDDETMLNASRRAVAELYPFIAPGERVYDIGCGWGGPLAMLSRERHCRALGLTIARTQFRHIAAQGLPVRWGDAEGTTPPGLFDCALLLESFEHIRDKPRMLRMLRKFTGRLVMWVSCQDHAPPGIRFGGTMHMISSGMLRDMLEETGWRVIHWRDRRHETMPSWTVWHRRLREFGPTSDPHIEALREMAGRLAVIGDQWADNNPLIEVVAER